MITVFYSVTLAAALICTTIYMYMWHKHFDTNFTLIFTFVPVACVGYFFSAISQTLGEALFAQRIMYLGACFLQLFIVESIFNLCKIEIGKWIRTGMFLVISAVYAPVLTIGFNSSFYRNVSFEIIDGHGVLTREYGPAHTAMYAMYFVFFVIGMSAIFYTWIKKRQVSRTVLSLLVLPYVITVLCFFVLRKIIPGIDLVPAGYVMAQVIYLVIAYRVNLYNVSDTVIDSMLRDREIGYMSVDFRRRFLGCNGAAEKIVPELKDKIIDEVLGYKPAERKIRHFIDKFEKDEKENTSLFTLHSESGDLDDDMIFKVDVGYLYDGSRKRGYIITFTDDTANRKYIRLLDTYNEKLQSEVQEKTAHIVEMHDNLIMSLAMMVESRDNSTGGHIKRTSEGVRILIEEILAEKAMDLDPEFCGDVIKAAPMHDLGKIAVDDAVLRKPGKFTDEEYNEMKKHAAEGARVIHEILLNTEDESFKVVAENVAHYHHERWDGSGYPEGLKGEDIPTEARIMAIADVYDALVSKRVYKDAFDFEKADRIIMEGMGTQFDPALEKIYVNARPKLEEYYKNQS
ncbi:MAG: HD domain-containing protein [Lachnospiraceae bacterium]|nr:HD domain-containing protein [Lachnospiraceae bacterium]MBP5702593.1 HD domain-containing protein [Lachnospiraceae bacterium]